MVNNPGTQDLTRLYNFAGMDDIVSNERTRAIPVATTYAGNATFGTSYASSTLGANWISGFGTPRTGAASGAQTLQVNDLLTGIITFTPQSTVTLAIDTAANLVNGVNQISAGAVIGDVIQCLLCNGSAASSMSLSTNTGVTFDTNQSNTTIASGLSRVIYVRLTGVKGGSEAAVVYF
jgi:hypothetical protein